MRKIFNGTIRRGNICCLFQPGNIFLCFLVAATTLLFYSSRTQAQNYLFDHFTMADGLPSNTNYRCAGDTEGFIWIATSNGAARFDGKTFAVFHESDGLPDNDIVYLFIDKKNRVWFCGFNGKIAFYADGIMHTAATDKWLQPLQSGNFVIYSAQDTAQNIYLVDRTGHIRCITHDDKIISFAEQGNVFFVHNKIWRLPDRTAGIPAHFLHSLYGKDSIPLPDYFIGMVVRKVALFPSLRGNIFCRNLRSVYMLGNKPFSSELLCYAPTTLNRVIYINDSNIALFAPGNGIYIYDTHSKKITRHLLAGETLTDAFMNTHGDLWCTSQNKGLFYLPACRGKAHYITTAEKLQDEKCTALYTASENVLWVGMDNAILQKLDDRKPVSTILLSHNKNAFSRISSIVYTPAGYIAIASDVGMYLLDKNGTNLRQVMFTAPENKNPVYLSAVKSCSVAANGDILIVVTNYIERLRVVDMNAQTPVAQLVVSSPERVLCAFEDSRQHTWFATTKGLNKIEGCDTICLYLKNGLLAKRILQIGETTSGYIVLATDGAGMIVLKNETVFAHITTKNGLPGNICRKIFITGDTVYAATPDGVAIAGYKHGQGFFVHAVTGKDGLLSLDCRDVSVMGDQLYAATDKGISILALNNIFHADPVPYTYLKTIVADGKNIVVKDSHVSLRYGIKSIMISYGTVSQNAAAGMEYRYRTAPENDWVVTDAASFVYNDPRPQKMQVTIQSRYKGGAWDKGILLSVDIAPGFYQTTWFIVLLVFLLTVSVCGGFYFYYRKQRRQLYNRNKLMKLESQANQAMMNPHFVFNALNSVQHFMNQHDNYAANQYLTRFSRLIRRHLELNRKQYISLEEEFDFLRLYLDVEKSRCDDKLSFSIEVLPGITADEIFIPVLILQPLVENAVWHGITPKTDGGHILITAGSSGNENLEICIEDDGVGFPAGTGAEQQPRQSMGLSIIKDRLHLLSKLYGREFSINYNHAGKKGTHIIVRFPLLTITSLIPVS